MELPIFKLAADCDRCVFGDTAQSIGIPTRHIAGTGHDTALLIIGDKPGVEEDTAYAHFVGNAGQILQEVYVEAGELSKYADVYATNAVRCKPPKDIEPRVTQYKACRGHLDEDVYELSKRYPRIVVLGVGAGAARALRSSSLEDATFAQGAEISFGDNERRVVCPAFWTDNPANLFTHRNPTRVDAVADHLQLLGDYLRTGQRQVVLLGDITPEVATRELGIPRGPISFDIESYGCIAGLPNQRVFNAKRAIATDGIAAGQLVATIALSWRDKDRLRSAIYVASNPEHVEAFSFAISDAINRGCWLLGMNTAFDVGFLRADPRFSQLFTRGKCKLLDLAVYNYLDSEVRMERSLKNISPLKGTTTYDDEEIDLKKGERYDSDADPRLHKYNAKDAIATLINYEKMLASIASTYGPDSDKLSERTRQWYNELLWFAIESGEDGVYIDREQLIRVDAEMKRRADRVERWVKASGGSINGTGSGKWKSTLSVEAATEAGLLNDPRLARTKTGISANNANFELYLGCLDRKSPLSRKVRAIQLFTQFRDIRSRYTNAMLVGRKVKGYKGLHPGSLVLDTGLVHPTWYIIPGQFEDNSKGGTRQGRITCRQPGLQNLAKPVKACLSTRFDYLLEADLSQIELRTAALISGDSVMCGDYNAGRDRHLTTARVILREVLAYMITNKRDSAFGFDRASIEFLALDPSVTKKTHGIDIWRQLGKTLNFLVLFRGGAKKAQETAQRDLGILLPLDVWTRIIVSFYRECHVFGRWQGGWINDAKRYGRCVLPLLGQSRLFHGGVSGVEKAMNEVANFPIQTMAANALIDGQRLCRERFREAGLRAVSSLSIYDAMYVECPQDELETVKSIIDESLRNIPYWLDLQRHYGREVPVGYDIKILRTRNVDKS